MILATMTLIIVTFCHAQNKPTTAWPYRYAMFTDGTVFLTDGSKKNAKFNICLDKEQLHYVDGDMICLWGSSDVVSVKIGEDVYKNVYGQMLKVLAMSDKCILVESQEIDFSALNSTGAAYGSSSNTIGTMSLSSLEGIGGSNSSTALNHMELMHNKDNGKVLPLIVKEYLCVKAYKVFCAKKDILDLPIDKNELKGYLKDNKVKWKDTQSLMALGVFLYDRL